MVVLVNESLPKIRRVMIRGEECCVWELQRQTWKTRHVKSFSDWDIIRGACDTI
ncbi:hypothetical protein M408DRAFT_329680 [Serendipita vermifera MAFF 305830]|uniref:Uncharacterized protein n=1 Tax=Serendipita vermifera MAFF 305830 TaxID=933852 RepID=A0A0C3B788_SERVB|nr:hypothetical protein M408DRAFT_329680 [Serendipita vermifera MAFF 305830]